MFRDEVQALSHQIAEETLQRIRKDRKRASVRVGQLLRVIEEKLLDADLQVESLRRWCGANDKNVSTQFKTELGLAPWAYITQCRMEIAGRMLAASDYEIWRIGLAVGYVSGHSFGRAFKTWSGQSPKKFRAQARAGTIPASQLPMPGEPLSRKDIRRALAGELATDEAEALVDRLDTVRDRIAGNYSNVSPPIPAPASIEPIMAENLWRWIEPLPYEVQKAAIKSQAPAFRTPALMHVLCTQSVDAEEPAVAVERAGLVLLCMHPVAESLGKKSGNWLARAHIITAHACRRADLLDVAEEAFNVAGRLLDFLEDEAHPIIVLELFLYQTHLEIARNRVDRAIMMGETALEIHALLTARLNEQADRKSKET